MAIYVKFAEEKKPKSIKEFLLIFYTTKYRNQFQQVYAVETFNDKDCVDLQSNHIRRSFDDMLELVKTYYPSTTPKILMHNLLRLEIPYHHIYLTNCNDMRRIRISFYKNSYGFYANYESICNVTQMGSKYSWEHLLNMLNINNNTDLNNYINNER